MTWSERLKRWVDRVQAALIGATLVGSTLAFGGAVWWFRPVLALTTGLLLVLWVVRVALEGRLSVWKSPLTAVGLLALVLGLAQLVPLPGPVLRLVSPKGAEMVSMAGVQGRMPVSMDRSATLKWIGGAGAGLILFCVSGCFTDRVGRLKWVWASVLAGFAFCTVLGVVQLVGGLGGLYGGIEPGKGPVWAPTMGDTQLAPGVTLLRRNAGSGGGWAVSRPERAFAVGSMMGGPGAYLALASLALPLGVGLALREMAPRGSREALGVRLREEGGAAKVVVLLGVVVVGAGLSGVLGGPVLAVPTALGLGISGLSGLRVWGLRVVSVVVTAVVLVGLGVGVWVGPMLGPVPGRAPVAVGGWKAAEPDWKAAARVGLDFPVLGAGLGSYPAVVPHYKTTDETPNSARSSVAQWWAESGLAGMALLGLGVAWCLWRLPGALKRVERADWVLPASLVGAMASFALFSTIHWSVELSAVALSACAVAGTANRWLSGGTDLFVERA